MTKAASVVVAATVLFAATCACAQTGKRSTARATSTAPSTTPLSIERVVADYTVLYNARDLEEWRKLFHPDLTVASPEADGGISVRNLKQFYNAQKKAFDAGNKMSERLQNIAIEKGNRIARVAADFVFTSNGKPSRGQLGLHLVQGREGWKITSIVYSYNPGQEPR
jgi:hypothetical protein